MPLDTQSTRVSLFPVSQIDPREMICDTFLLFQSTPTVLILLQDPGSSLAYSEKNIPDIFRTFMKVFLYNSALSEGFSLDSLYTARKHHSNLEY